MAAKDPAIMSAAAINAEIESIDKKWSKIIDEMIEAGRGHEKHSETLTKSDPLSLKFLALSDRRGMLSYEVTRRAGPGMYRLPKGFGPMKNPATVNQQIDALLKRRGNPRAKPTRETFGEVVGKSVPFGKLADYSSLKTQKARLLKGFTEIGFSKTIAASIVDSAQIRQAQRNRDGRAMFLQGADLLAAAKSHGYFEEPASNPRSVTLVAAKNPRKAKARITCDEYETQYSKDGKTWNRWNVVCYEDMARKIARDVSRDFPTYSVRVVKL